MWSDYHCDSHIITKYSATLKANVICRGYVGILLSASICKTYTVYVNIYIESRWHRG